MTDIALTDPLPGDWCHMALRHCETYIDGFGYPPVFETYALAVIAQMAQDYSPPRDRLIVARRGSQRLGTIAIRFTDDETAQLRFLLLEPAARGAGLGRRLVAAVIDHARAHAARTLFLETASDLAPARALYAAAGFRLESAEPVDFLPPGVTSERWSLVL
ncbi:GNAT family N-acetyltransferase [Sandaracinobacteroides saxicola]|uniref:GNAT family N-acetyltransferase n=1 Tax=Sandaracinobacteroides saxicola TaxID=2759707 RepID=A0A7G5IG66_9SPHN|nr:GNAT family N-acetyltransferase [Sandaracinobacteroides saxicola]QMW22358.1 GNAT family N-acetyltransferase [Sandaracinobacteroides saxicola]